MQTCDNVIPPVVKIPLNNVLELFFSIFRTSMVVPGNVVDIIFTSLSFYSFLSFGDIIVPHGQVIVKRCFCISLFYT